MQTHSVLIFLAGLVVIVVGAEMLLRGAARVARLLSVRPIVIGLTVVSIGTSMPELAVGLAAAAAESSALAVGNIAGTNIFNILMVLGVSVLLRPLPLRLHSLKLELPVMIAASLVLIPMALDGVLDRAEGLLLLAGAVAYTVALVRASRREGAAMRREFAEEFGQMAPLPAPGLALPATRLGLGAWNSLLLLVGIALTVFGGELLVVGALSLAREFGVSESFVGLSIVAVGTSAPELATALVATRKDDRDVAVGNLVGSNIFNILLILGVTSVVAPGGAAVSRDMLWIDLPFAALAAIACLPMFRVGRRVSRTEGALFVGAYAIYLGSLVLLRA